MNERFMELAGQAGLYVDLEGSPWPRAMSAEECEAAYKKFAELIVRECAKICFRESEGHNMAFGEHCGIVIKEHFGVEK